MSKALTVARKLFSGINTQYLVKSYFFSVIMTFLMFGAMSDSMSPFIFIYIIICGLFFPFATVVWDDFISTLMGDNDYITSAYYANMEVL